MSGPTKSRIWNVVMFVGVAYAVYIVYGLFNASPSVDECLAQRAKETITQACLDILMEEGR